MKKILCICIVLLLLLGCGGPEETGPAEQDAALPTVETPARTEPAPAGGETVTRPAPETSQEPVPASETGPAPTEPDPATEPPPEVPRPRICIDPGHYAGVNAIGGKDAYGYAEGDFTLQVGLALQRILLEKYGIESCLTRTGGSITIGGYSDSVLDGGKLTLRGAWAAEQDCDFFISLHTNANLPEANGSPTLLQPIGITKTVILANTLCLADEGWLAVANEVGERVTAVNNEIGIADGRPFRRAAGPEDVTVWTDAANDSLTEPGTVFCRLRDDGQDYYGVLRGAAQAGVPGIIVEHGFHTVAEMRRAAAEGDLAERWAEADADGIAAGLGLRPLP